jgi:hypothetical protein
MNHRVPQPWAGGLKIIKNKTVQNEIKNSFISGRKHPISRKILKKHPISPPK